MTSSTGTYRIGDGAPVTIEAAQAMWVSMARDVLVGVARRYDEVVTISRLADEVQRQSGVRTKTPTAEWIGAVLQGVSDDCARRGEPMLSALCVRDGGSIHDGYADVVEAKRGTPPVDVEMHAAEERLSCYRHFGAELPEDGGRPKVWRRPVAPPPPARRAAAARRPSTPRKQTVERPVAICPTCFMQLPASGRCDSCG